MIHPQHHGSPCRPVDEGGPSSTGLVAAHRPPTSTHADSSTIHTPYYYCSWFFKI